MPFREATALVTVEREGVAETLRDELSGKDPVVEVPVHGSLRAERLRLGPRGARPRRRAVQPTALVDLAKPAFKLGIAEIRVGWRAHELAVRVEPEQPSYRVREKAQVQDRRAHAGRRRAAGRQRGGARRGRRGPARARAQHELEAARRDDGTARLRVQTATAQMQVVGKRHFGRKARAGRRRRRPAGDARALRHAAALEGARAARRGGRRAGRGPAERLAHQLPHRRRRRRGGDARFGTGRSVDPRHAGPDGARGPAAARARGRSLRRGRSRCATPPTPRSR